MRESSNFYNKRLLNLVRGKSQPQGGGCDYRGICIGRRNPHCVRDFKVSFAEELPFYPYTLTAAIAVHNNSLWSAKPFKTYCVPFPSLAATDRDASHVIKSSFHCTGMTPDENILLWHSSVKTRAFVKVIPNTPTEHKRTVCLSVCVWVFSPEVVPDHTTKA